MKFLTKSLKLKDYLIICATYLCSLMVVSLCIYKIKYFFKISEIFLYFFSSFIEISLLFLLFYILFQTMKNIRLLKWLYCLFFIIIFVSYFIQSITFIISGDFLPVLAIENLHEYKYYFNNLNYFILGLSLFFLSIDICLLYFVRNIKIEHKINIKVFIIFFLCFCIFFLPIVRKHAPGFSLLTNSLEVFCSRIILKNKNLPLENFLYDKTNKEYPFLKNNIYNNNKYFKKDIDNPNVIIIFMEGISAKFVGCYENNFKDLTPNIDKFANNENVCKFVNYYNHTAATFRGIIGTLSSAYPYHGGYEEGLGWKDGDNSEKYKQIKYSSLPKLLAKKKYETIMFSPHIDKSAFNNMIKMLGFNELFFAQKNCEEFLNGYEYFNEYLSDKGIFLSLEKYLVKHEKDIFPKFICLYNVGTHALKDVDKNGKKYGDGKNKILNRIHNLDYELGQFLNYFYNSSYAKNTYLIITTDHCTYYEPAYKALFSNDEVYFFIDQIPLLIYSPFKNLPRNIDTNFRNSLDFAPTILNLLNIKNLTNSFLGYSLFDLYPYNINIGFYSTYLYNVVVQIKGNRYFIKDVPKKYHDEVQSYLQLIEIYQYYEQKNKLFPE